jgi:hypothetical protein
MTSSSRDRRRPRWAWPGLLGLWLLLAGCAARPDWTGRVGTYSFDDAVREFGPPDKTATLTDGSSVSEWLLSRGRLNEIGLPSVRGFGPYAGFYPRVATDFYQTPDRDLRLTFGVDKKLQSAGQFRR